MPRSELVAPGLWRIPTVPMGINAFLVAGARGLALIDPGLPNTFKRLVRGIESAGHAASDVRSIIVTHAHRDHAGALQKLKTLSGARVLAHEMDRGYLEAGTAPPHDPSSRLGRLMARLPAGFPACPVDEGFAEGDDVDGLRVIHTPGHTPGHAALLHRDSGTLLTGDAVINPLMLRYPFSGFCTDLAAMRASAARLGTLDFEAAAFAHGLPIRTGARERIASLGARDGR